MACLDGHELHPECEYGTSIVYGIPFTIEWDIPTVRELARVVLPKDVYDKTLIESNKRYLEDTGRVYDPKNLHDDYDDELMIHELLADHHYDRIGAYMYTTHDNFYTWVLGVEVSFVPGLTETWREEFHAWPKKIDHPYGPEVEKLFNINPQFVKIIHKTMIGDIGHYVLPVGYCEE